MLMPKFQSMLDLVPFDDDTAMEEPEADDAENEATDELGHALCGEREDCDSEKERLKF